MSSSYHPQTDGQTEVVNRTLEQYLRCFVGEKLHGWVDWLPWAEFSYNTSKHSATKFSPFQAVYGIPPPSLLSYVPGTTKVHAVDTVLCERAEVLRNLRRNLVHARDRMKSRADHHRKEMEFSIGQFVYLKLQPYRQHSLARRSSQKLSPRFFGPYRVLERVGPVAYRLELPEGSMIHNVFHVSLLKKHEGPLPSVASSPQPLPLEEPPSPWPEEILDARVVQKGKFRPREEVLVKWTGKPDSDATWENRRRLQRAYPTFILADKNSLRGEE